MTEALAQTVLQMGMTNYQQLRSYAVRTFPLRTLLSFIMPNGSTEKIQLYTQNTKIQKIHSQNRT